MEDDRPTAARGAEQEEDEEDALPDWTAFAKIARANTQDDDAILVPFIPRRGEKDFEPITASSSLPSSSKEATLSQHQQTMLNESRSALFTALSTGSRHHSSRGHNSFTWRPELDGGRATCDGPSSYGIHFLNMGRHHLERKQMELLPEEALYMVERGVIELWREGETTEDGPARVPMSVQQAWSEIIGHDELTVERFQVYAYLKRLGYILDRARSAPSTSDNKKGKQVARPSLLSQLSLPLSTFRDLVSALLASIRLLFRRTENRIQLIATCVIKRSEGRLASLVSGRRWASYDQIFSRLQIIPTGHDTSLPRASIARKVDVLAPLVPSPSTESSTLPKLVEHPYQPFFNVYKPVTKYRKTAPPPPDFQLVIINSTTTSMPDIFEFTDMFSTVPHPDEDTLRPPPRAIRVGLPPPPPRAPRPGFKPRAPPPPPSRWQKLLSYTPFGKKPDPPRKPMPYQRLKVGRRGILVAVVDNGTISILRFSESEFGKLPWSGKGRSA